MTMLDIKNLSTLEMITLIEDINKELRFREGVGKDIRKRLKEENMPPVEHEMTWGDEYEG